jgi:hypothetical protein
MMPYAIALTASFAGLAALAIAMPRHARTLSAMASTRGRFLVRLCGSLLLGLSLTALVQHDGWQVAAVGFAGVVTLSGLLVAALLSWRPRWVSALAFCGSGVAIALYVIGAGQSAG